MLFNMRGIWINIKYDLKKGILQDSEIYFSSDDVSLRIFFKVNLLNFVGCYIILAKLSEVSFTLKIFMNYSFQIVS